MDLNKSKYKYGDLVYVFFVDRVAKVKIQTIRSTIVENQYPQFEYKFYAGVYNDYNDKCCIQGIYRIYLDREYNPVKTFWFPESQIFKTKKEFFNYLKYNERYR